MVHGYFFVKFLIVLKHQHKLNLNCPVENFLFKKSKILNFWRTEAVAYL